MQRSLLILILFFGSIFSIPSILAQTSTGSNQFIDEGEETSIKTLFSEESLLSSKFKRLPTQNDISISDNIQKYTFKTGKNLNNNALKKASTKGENYLLNYGVAFHNTTLFLALNFSLKNSKLSNSKEGIKQKDNLLKNSINKQKIEQNSTYWSPLSCSPPWSGNN